MNKIKFVLLGCIAAFFMTGCSELDQLDKNQKETYLDLSEEIVNFDKTKGEKVVEITTNAKFWTAKPDGDCKWLKLISGTDALTISAEANPTGRERTATVSIVAGSQSAKLTVRQMGSEALVELSDTVIASGENGGSYTINLKHNDVPWEIEGTELYSWIKVFSNESSITVKVEPNKTEEKRIAKFYITSPTMMAQEIIVEQMGIQPFILPYMPNKKITQADVLAYEKERGSFYVSSFSNQFNGRSYNFTAKDRFSSSIIYAFKKDVMRYSMCIVQSEKTTYASSPEFEKFVQANGFSRIEDTKVDEQKGFIEDTYEFKGHYFRIILKARTYGKEQYSLLTYTVFDTQVEDLKTFDTFPYRNKTFFNTSNFFEVKKWEETQGGTIETARERGQKNPNVISFGQFHSVTNENSHLFSVYYFEETKKPYVSLLWQKVDLYSNVSLGMWQDEEGKYHLTKELKALLEKEGIEYRGVNGKFINYVKEDENLAVLFTVYEINDDPPLFGIGFFKIDQEKTAELKKSDNMDLLFQTLSQEMENNSRKWFNRK